MCECKMKQFPWGRAVLITKFEEDSSYNCVLITLCPNAPYVSRLAWERLGVPPEELEEVAGHRDVWVSLLKLLPPRPAPTGEAVGNRWMAGYYLYTLLPFFYYHFFC